ncbi:hypothetical protein F8388_006131 [Cannabis sativa]|uniref:Uncharacterized protein n=1 Tax=Cannabis sativa TaxID=3483 RepID=A0A7J6G935_CANSA|nr:hypothetical protein F8388_006131 [Cannabis sativa]
MEKALCRVFRKHVCGAIYYLANSLSNSQYNIRQNVVKVTSALAHAGLESSNLIQGKHSELPKKLGRNWWTELNTSSSGKQHNQKGTLKM